MPYHAFDMNFAFDGHFTWSKGQCPAIKAKILRRDQAPDTLSAAGAAGVHSWGLMLPTSTRTPGVNYTSAVAVRYPPLNREVGGQWIVGTHSSGGLEGLVGGYQLVIWKKPSNEFLHARGADLSSVIEPLLQDLIDIHSDESSVLVMCARNEDRDQLLTDSICRGHPQIKVQSVASSAGATATASIVNQPFNGHLNGRPSDPFDQEECYARCTVAATRAQSLTVIISQLDMAGMMGMMQVLAARARPIHQVYHGATTWTLPSLNGMSHQEQSDAEVASWDISRVTSWSEQTLPPLALAYKHRKVEAGETISQSSNDCDSSWLRPLNFQEQGPSFHLWSGLSRPIMTSGIEWHCHPNTQTSCCYGHMRWMANNMPCFGWVLRIRKQIRFRLYCDIGRAPPRSAPAFSKECISSMPGKLLPPCDLIRWNMMTLTALKENFPLGKNGNWGRRPMCAQMRN